MQHIKKIYLYMVSLISLVILVIAGIILINLALKTWVFTKADDSYYYQPRIYCDEVKNPDGSIAPKDPACADPEKYEKEEQEAEKKRRSAQKQRDAAQAVAMIIVATPVFYYHWKLARKEA